MKSAAIDARTPADPTADDPAYLVRRRAIARQAAGPDATPHDIAYRPDENRTWATVHRALADRWARHAHPDLVAAWDRLDLPADEIPQLREVSAQLEPLTGFRFRAVAGLVDKEVFFAGLAQRVFLSTQYVRHPDRPLYTPEPDLIHEVLGHANALADRRLAELHRLAGEAMLRVHTAEARQFLADVFWFSGEFGVVETDDGCLAYGAGLLSSTGELEAFRSHATIRPLDLAAMGTLAYDIDHYQPVLFAARSLDHVLDTVGGFFARVDDDEVAHLARQADTP